MITATAAASSQSTHVPHVDGAHVVGRWVPFRRDFQIRALIAVRLEKFGIKGACLSFVEDGVDVGAGDTIGGVRGVGVEFVSAWKPSGLYPQLHGSVRDL